MSEIRVSYQGLDQLAQMTHDQDLHLSEALGVVQSKLSNTGAFTGFLDLFQGTYEEALNAATDGLTRVGQSASTMSTSLSNSLAEYQKSDSGVEQTMTTLEGNVSEGEKYDAPKGDESPIPGAPEAVGDAKGAYDAINKTTGPDAGNPVTGQDVFNKYTGVDSFSNDPSSLTAPLSAYDDAKNAITNADQIGDALDDGDDMDEFEQENR